LNLQTVAEIAKARDIWDYEAQPKEWLGGCPLCGAWDEHFETFATRDRYGFKALSVTCTQCGLNFLPERMTREAYARFYETAYRPLVSAFHGREINAQTIQPEQEEYAKGLAQILQLSLPDSARTLLDVGGSTGVVAGILGARLAIRGLTIIDPSPAEAAIARGRGIEAILGTIEDAPLVGRHFDLITLCQTADHLLDLMGSLKKIRGLLSKDGLFWSDIVDFDVTREVKIDHPFNLTEKTYREFLRRAGFKLLQVNYAPDGVHIGFLCRAAE